MAKSQIAMEFMITIIFAAIFTTLLATVAYYYLQESYTQRDIEELQDLGKSLQDEVILAHTVQPGYTRKLYVPPQLRNIYVNISGSSEDIVINYKGSDILFRIPPTQGTFSTGYNTISKQSNGSVTIS
jgi:hypothetical protein